MTDPAVQTKDPERFKLNDLNLNEDGFKFFFSTHKCNEFCEKLGLRSNREMVASGNLVFRELWPTMDPTVCCSNKLCRSIIRLASARESDKFPDRHWCEVCWPQLRSSTTLWICAEPGPNHEFEVSRFFHESQGELPPRKCPTHLGRDTTVSSAAVMGGSLWKMLRSVESKNSVSGRTW